LVRHFVSPVALRKFRCAALFIRLGDKVRRVRANVQPQAVSDIGQVQPLAFLHPDTRHQQQFEVAKLALVASGEKLTEFIGGIDLRNSLDVSRLFALERNVVMSQQLEPLVRLLFA
jgi:hypothetical protein